MSLNNWINSGVNKVADNIQKINSKDGIENQLYSIIEKQKILKLLIYVRSAIFPEIYEGSSMNILKQNIRITNNLKSAALELSELIEIAFENKQRKNDISEEKYLIHRKKTDNIVKEFIEKLQELRQILSWDIKAAFYYDVSARSIEEIVLCYPSIEAIVIYRIAHLLHELNVPLIPRIMSEYAHSTTGIDIHPGARIGKSFFINNGTGSAIGETCIIGDNVKIYQGVTLGAKSLLTDEDNDLVKGTKRDPSIEDNVTIYAGAVILGGDTIVGNNSIIGGNVWLTHSIPANSLVYNSQPAPIIKKIY